MASSSIIDTNIIIIVHHRRRRPKSLIRFGKSLNERFPAYGEEEEKNALYLITKVLVGGTIFMSPTGGGTIIFRGHPS